MASRTLRDYPKFNELLIYIQTKIVIFSESVKRNPKLLLLSLLLRAHVRFVRSGYSAGRALFFRGGLSGGGFA